MSSLSVFGRYRELGAHILVDPSRSCSVVSASFALHHRIPRTVRYDSSSGQVDRIFCTGPITVPSISGYYQSVFEVAVMSQDRWDVVLGRDWCDATGGIVCDGRVADPPAPLAQAGRHVWYPQLSGMCHVFYLLYSWSSLSS